MEWDLWLHITVCYHKQQCGGVVVSLLSSHWKDPDLNPKWMGGWVKCSTVHTSIMESSSNIVECRGLHMIVVFHCTITYLCYAHSQFLIHTAFSLSFSGVTLTECPGASGDQDSPLPPWTGKDRVETKYKLLYKQTQKVDSLSQKEQVSFYLLATTIWVRKLCR